MRRISDLNFTQPRHSELHHLTSLCAVPLLYSRCTCTVMFWQSINAKYGVQSSEWTAVCRDSDSQQSDSVVAVQDYCQEPMSIGFHTRRLSTASYIVCVHICTIEACTGTEIISIPTSPAELPFHPHSSHKNLFPSPVVQQSIEYGLSCNEKYILNLGCIIELTDNNTIYVSKIIANILQQFENRFLLLQVHNEKSNKATFPRESRTILFYPRGSPTTSIFIPTGTRQH